MAHEPTPTAGGRPDDPHTSSADVGNPLTGAAGSTAAYRGDTDPPSAFPFLAPKQAPDELGRLGPYRVLGPLGEGGMGMVFKAQEIGLRRLVALKVMLPKHAENPTAKARFLREARAQAAVEHDHVLAIFQIGEDRGVPFIAMPLLQGQTLSAAIKANPKVPVPEVLRVGREMAEGLAAAHAKGLIHRDVKPANVWLEGTRRRVKVLDFGLARATTEDLADSDEPATKPGTMMGTPAYMSPEQARGDAVDPRTDLFSLGVVLYEMATGGRPFRGRDVMGLLTSLAVDHPTPPREKNPAVPEALSSLIMGLLSKKPSSRPSSAAAVAEAIRAHRRGRGPRAGGVRPASGERHLGGHRRDGTGRGRPQAGDVGRRPTAPASGGRQSPECGAAAVEVGGCGYPLGRRRRGRRVLRPQARRRSRPRPTRRRRGRAAFCCGLRRHPASGPRRSKAKPRPSGSRTWTSAPAASNSIKTACPG